MNAIPKPHPVAAACGLALYPVALTLPLFGSSDVGPVVRVMGVALVAVLLVGVVRQIPLLGLAVILLGTVVAVAAAPPSGPWNNNDGSRQMTLLAFVSADVALGYLVAVRPRRQWIVGIGLSVLVQALAIGAFAEQPNLIGLGVIALLALLVACMAGLRDRERREHAAALRGQAVAEAVTAERLRIARELHDMVSHSIGVIAIQSGVAARVIETQPHEARTALEAIEATSRETLAGLRRTLVALRRAEPGGDAPLVPSTGIGDLGDLVESARRDAGVHVDLVREGRERRLPPDVDLAAYRIVQESLTNVARHAGTDACRVLVAYGDDELFLEIVDAGAGSPAGVPGMGITGMGERVSLLHGEFSAGPGPEGGFRVAARIPLPGAGR
ncbi:MULTISPECIES: sensor histidine kinase [unclassified Streptomyces]|uniref:sensor histidine kinase n=1 Tax=unclassified Streptomyces TaxID=2593676 RepID=UPI00036EA0B6|nr:sensor histidine kinase [Streptomyces sp. HmicA12]